MAADQKDPANVHPDPAILPEDRRRLYDAVMSRSNLRRASLHIGKSASYLHQYVWRGAPKTLPADVRAKLASFLGVDADALFANADDSDPIDEAGAAALAGQELRAIEGSRSDQSGDPSGDAKAMRGDQLRITVLPVEPNAGQPLSMDIARRGRSQRTFGLIAWSGDYEPAISVGSVLIADPAVPPRPGDRVVRRRSDGGYDIGVLREVTSKGYRVDALGSGKPGKIEGVDLRDLAKLSAILFP